MATAQGSDAAAALVAEFHASRAGVRGLVESGVASVPPIFLAPRSPSSPPPLERTSSAIPAVDLSLPRSETVRLVRAAARTCGFFHVTNHGVEAGTVASAVSAVRAFHELPLAARSALYSPAPVGGVIYSTMPNDPPRRAADPAAIPLLPWRDTLYVIFGPPAPDHGRLPADCRDALLEYQRVVAELGKKMAGLLSEALGVGAERLENATGVETSTIACHYYPPSPEPARVVGSMEHTDPCVFTVLAQDCVGGLQVRLEGGADDGLWADVPSVPGALLVNIGDILKVISNDEYKSVEHRVVIKSNQDARVSIGMFFKPGKHDDSYLIGPLPELVAAESPERYRSFTMTEFLNSRIEFGHGRTSIDRFRIGNELLI